MLKVSIEKANEHKSNLLFLQFVDLVDKINVLNILLDSQGYTMYESYYQTTELDH